MMHYNLACVECLLGNKPDCATHLKRAVSLDPSLKQAVGQDPDLKRVRKEPWCVALMRM
jgi:hypothetical protein